MQRAHSVSFSPQAQPTSFPLATSELGIRKRVLFTLPQNTQNSQHWVSLYKRTTETRILSRQGPVRTGGADVLLQVDTLLEESVVQEGGDHGFCSLSSVLEEEAGCAQQVPVKSQLPHLLFTVAGGRWFWASHFLFMAKVSSSWNLLPPSRYSTWDIRVELQSSFLWIARVLFYIKVDEGCLP